MDRRFLTIMAVLVFGVGAFLVFGGNSKDKSTTASSSNASVTSHITGEGKKNVKLVEYGDFQCPACGAFYPLVEQVREKYKTDITFQFRNFPLANIHPNALAAHRAAEAASKQGKFWEMYNKLYQTQDNWSKLSNPVTIFEGYANELNLNLQQFKNDFASSQTLATINADISAGNKLSVSSTPTFFIDGTKVEQNPRSLEDFYKLIDAEITKKNPTTNATTDAKSEQ